MTTADPPPVRMSGLALLLLALATTVPIWLLVVLPVLSGAKAHAHEAHFATVFAHAVGGTAMLFLGAAALYIGWTRRFFRLHKWVGGAFLIGVALGAGAGLYLSALNPHPLAGVNVATGALALTTLAFAAMAWRAARNKRFDSHREWMIRTYVLAWTFVFCRMVMRIPGIADDPAAIAPIIWSTWIAPVLLCEIALQWGRGAPLRR